MNLQSQVHFVAFNLKIMNMHKLKAPNNCKLLAKKMIFFAFTKWWLTMTTEEKSLRFKWEFASKSQKFKSFIIKIVHHFNMNRQKSSRHATLRTHCKIIKHTETVWFTQIVFFCSYWRIFDITTHSATLLHQSFIFSSRAKRKRA